MKLAELVECLKVEAKTKALCSSCGFDAEYDEISIYLEDSLDLDSEVYLFDPERSGENLVYKEDGVTYIHLFPVSLAVELVESRMGLGKEVPTQVLSERLLEYRVNDA